MRGTCVVYEPVPEPFAIVVAYGSVDELRACLDSLGAARVVVVDNSQSEQVRVCVEELGGTYLATPTNVGFAAGVNVGIRAVPPDADVLLLNPDARISWPQVLRLQTVLHADPTLAAVAPQLLNADGTPQRTVWPVPSPRTVWADALGLVRFLRTESFLSGAVLLVRREAWDDVGTFDERFFLYAEETDWQMRAFQRDWRVRLEPAVTAVHAGGGSSASERRRLEHSVRSARLLAQRWYPGAAGGLMLAGSAAAALRRSLSPDPSTRAAQRVVLRALLRA